MITCKLNPKYSQKSNFNNSNNSLASLHREKGILSMIECITSKTSISQQRKKPVNKLYIITCQPTGYLAIKKPCFICLDSITDFITKTSSLLYPSLFISKNNKTNSTNNSLVSSFTTDSPIDIITGS